MFGTVFWFRRGLPTVPNRPRRERTPPWGRYRSMCSLLYLEDKAQESHLWTGKLPKHCRGCCCLARNAIAVRLWNAAGTRTGALLGDTGVRGDFCRTAEAVPMWTSISPRACGTWRLACIWIPIHANDGIRYSVVSDDCACELAGSIILSINKGMRSSATRGSPIGRSCSDDACRDV